MACISDQAIEDRWLLAHVEDAVDICTRDYAAYYTGFLDERQTTVVKAWLKKNSGNTQSFFWDGHEDAERMILGVFAQDYAASSDGFPVAAVGFSFRQGVLPAHRDVLGSLIGCGIARDKIGDILCTDGLAVAFVRRELAPFIVENVTKIGREGVGADYPFRGELPSIHSFKPISGTLASARLDGVLKVLLGMSRERACDLIRAALVSINHQPCQSVCATLKAGDILSVKGSGRFIIDDLSGTTSKGRLIMKARKYI